MSKNGFWLLCLVPLAGCGLEGGLRGNWELRNVTPPEATGHYDIAAATFNPDCTYVAKIRKNDRTEISRGTYDYDQWYRRLTLRSGGVERTYTATVWFGMQLNVETQTPEGKPMTAIMKRTREAVVPEVAPAPRQGQ
jgi:hypothetical protein